MGETNELRHEHSDH